MTLVTEGKIRDLSNLVGRVLEWQSHACSKACVDKKSNPLYHYRQYSLHIYCTKRAKICYPRIE